jgi:hypothetical protein
MSFWQLAQCAWSDTAELDRYLSEHWEPSAVTQSHGAATATIWLRRSSERQPAYAAAPRPRLEHKVVRLTRA